MNEAILKRAGDLRYKLTYTREDPWNEEVNRYEIEHGLPAGADTGVAEFADGLLRELLPWICHPYECPRSSHDGLECICGLSTKLRELGLEA